MSKIRKLPRFEQAMSAVLIGTKEAVIAPMRPIIRKYNITEPQWRVMRVINDRGATDASVLAGVGLLHAPSVTRILKELETRNFIVRKKDLEDRRRTLVALTPKGRSIVKVISRDVLRILGEYTKRFGPERLDRLLDELRALSAAIKGVE